MGAGFQPVEVSVCLDGGMATLYVVIPEAVDVSGIVYFSPVAKRVTFWSWLHGNCVNWTGHLMLSFLIV